MGFLLEMEYLDKVSYRLRNFKTFRESSHLANFSCPFCGDSERDKTKARGYILSDQAERINFYCHNCNRAISFQNFLRDIDLSLFKAYQYEKFCYDTNKSRGFSDLREERRVETRSSPDLLKISKRFGMVKKEETPDDQGVQAFLSSLVPVQSLPDDHPAVTYLTRRFITDENILSDLFFMESSSQIALLKKYSDRFKNNKDSRIVIPIRGLDGSVNGFVCRDLSGASAIRYITLQMDSNVSLIYGLDRVATSRRVYCTEGVFDAMLIPNGLASLSSNFNSVCSLGLEDLVIVRDNEPRAGKEIQREWKRNLEAGHKMFLCPPFIVGKDLQECVASGELSIGEITSFIDQNVVSGPGGMIRYMEWSKK